MFKKCVEEEKHGQNIYSKMVQIIGLNEKLLGQYVEWIRNKRLRALGFDPVYDVGAIKSFHGHSTGYHQKVFKLSTRNRS